MRDTIPVRGLPKPHPACQSKGHCLASFSNPHSVLDPTDSAQNLNETAQLSLLSPHRKQFSRQLRHVGRERGARGLWNPGDGVLIFFFFTGPCILQAQSLSLSLSLSLSYTLSCCFLIPFFLSLYFPFFYLFSLELATCAVAIETAQKQNDKQIIHYRVHYRCSPLSNTSLQRRAGQQATLSLFTTIKHVTPTEGWTASYTIVVHHYQTRHSNKRLHSVLHIFVHQKQAHHYISDAMARWFRGHACCFHSYKWLCLIFHSLLLRPAPLPPHPGTHALTQRWTLKTGSRLRESTKGNHALIQCRNPDTPVKASGTHQNDVPGAPSTLDKIVQLACLSRVTPRITKRRTGANDTISQAS